MPTRRWIIAIPPPAPRLPAPPPLTRRPRPDMSQIQSGKTFNLHPVRSKSNPYRVLLLTLLIMGGAWLLQPLNRGLVQSPFNPTTTPHRSPQPYILAAQASFAAGKLEDPTSNQDAIGAYQQALELDP